MRQRTGAFILLAAMTCTTSSCDPATAVVVPVLVITATWQVEGEEGRTFRFDADQDDSEGLPYGTFQGFEDIDTGTTSAIHDLTGSWANGEIQFTLQRSSGNLVFSATFHENFPNRLTFHSPGETFVLVN
jgi:hypothetical protein